MSWGGYIPGELLTDPEFAARLHEELKKYNEEGNLTVSDNVITLTEDELDERLARSYDDGYSEGYDIGYSDAESETNDYAYSEGYDEGYAVGYDNGRDDTLAELDAA